MPAPARIGWSPTPLSHQPKQQWPRGGGTIQKNRSVRHSVRFSISERHARVKLLEEISLPSLLKRNFSSTTGRMDPTVFRTRICDCDRVPCSPYMMGPDTGFCNGREYDKTGGEKFFGAVPNWEAFSTQRALKPVRSRLRTLLEPRSTRSHPDRVSPSRTSCASPPPVNTHGPAPAAGRRTGRMLGPARTSSETIGAAVRAGAAEGRVGEGVADRDGARRATPGERSVEPATAGHDGLRGNLHRADPQEGRDRRGRRRSSRRTRTGS